MLLRHMKYRIGPLHASITFVKCYASLHCCFCNYYVDHQRKVDCVSDIPRNARKVQQMRQTVVLYYRFLWHGLQVLGLDKL